MAKKRFTFADAKEKIKQLEAALEDATLNQDDNIYQDDNIQENRNGLNSTR